MNGYDDRDAPQQRFGRPAATPILLTGLLVIILVALILNTRNESVRDRIVAQPQPIVPRGDLAGDESATIELFEQCSRSVVYVSPMVTRLQRTLFGYRDVVETGTGSGFIWDANGHIVTNFHVIQGANACTVILPDNSTYQAALVGEWADKDVAVLRIDAPPEKLVPIIVGASRGLRVGQKVFAIGNPYGLDFTLTTGVVSALNREIESVNGRTIQGVIQTDAAINPGNSGGPLLDSAGRLIGMTTAVHPQSGGGGGIGFAVPVDTINRVVPQLITHGRVIRPGLGVHVADDYLARRLGLDGVLILGLAKGGGAGRAGLRPTVEARDGRIILGDVIVKVGDTLTPNQDALLNALEKYAIGTTVDVTIERGVTVNGKGRREAVPVTLQAID